jgi:hypothetical protein
VSNLIPCAPSPTTWNAWPILPKYSLSQSRGEKGNKSAPALETWIEWSKSDVTAVVQTVRDIIDGYFSWRMK